MVLQTIRVVLEEGNIYPRYKRALLYRLLWTLPYRTVRPYLPDALVQNIKKVKGNLIETFTNQ